MSAGNRHSMFLTENGKVFASGSNRYGYGKIDELTSSSQLGTCKFMHTLTPDFLYPFKNIQIAHVSCGAYHTVFIEKVDREPISLQHVIQSLKFCDVYFEYV